MGMQLPYCLDSKISKKETVWCNKKLVDVLKRLANQKESTIIEGKLMSDHVHMLISIPPKYSVAQIVGFLKGKSAVYIAREISNYKNTKGHGFWTRGYFVSTVGADENIIKSYIKHQEKEDVRQSQLELRFERFP